VSAAPQDQINARAQLEIVARRLYADPTAALRTMRHDAHVYGAEAVSRNLQQNFIQYGEPAPDLHGPKRVRAQEALRVGGVAADVERWLVIDHSPPQQQMVADTSIEGVLRAPDAEALGRDPAAWDRRNPDPAHDLSPDERLAYEQLEAYGAAREREAQRQAAEARLHGIADHRENLQAAEDNLPQAHAALRREVEDTYSDGKPSLIARRQGISKGTSAVETIEEALKRDGPAETARRIRSGELLGKQQKPIDGPLRRWFARRDTAAEMEARERVAKRVETIGYYEGDIGKWSTFQPQDGPPITGAKNVRAALDREEAEVLADSGLGPARKEIARNRPVAPHPSREASQLGSAARHQLDRLSPESRDRVARAAQRSGADRVTAALGHLQTIHMAARSLREGVEPPGM
jgi:hypothetical protein